jgi:hypothetical protein
MAKEQFVWLLDSCDLRTGDGYRLTRVEHGKAHDADAVPEAVLAEWIKTGAAEIVKSKIKKQEE